MTRKRRLRFAYSISASWVITKHFRLILIKSTFPSLISDSLLLALRNLKFLVFSHASACTHIIFKWSSASLTSLLTEICVEWENFFYTRWLLFNLLLLKEILRVQVKKKSSTIEDTHRSLISISLSSFNLILISSNWLFFFLFLPLDQFTWEFMNFLCAEISYLSLGTAYFLCTCSMMFEAKNCINICWCVTFNIWANKFIYFNARTGMMRIMRRNLALLYANVVKITYKALNHSKPYNCFFFRF